MDEAGYEVIKPPRKKQKPKKPQKGPSAMGARSSSAEHLFDPTAEVSRFDVRGSRTANNSPQIRRKSPEAGGAAAAEEAPPTPNEGVDSQNHMYAQVVKNKNKKKKQKTAATGEESPTKPADEKEALANSDAKNGEEEAGGSKRGSGQDVGVMSTAEVKGEEPEVVGIPSGDIEHENAGSHLYAVVSTKKSKKSLVKSASLEHDKVATPTTNEAGTAQVPEEDVKNDVNGLDLPTLTSAPVPEPPRSGKPATLSKPPPKPVPFSSRAGYTSPTSPGVDSGVSISSQGSTGPERARSPVRQAPPVPRSAKVSAALRTPQNTLSPSTEKIPRRPSLNCRPPNTLSPSAEKIPRRPSLNCRPPNTLSPSAEKIPRRPSLNSRPPNFPPPPPPTPTSPPLDPPEDDEIEDPTYAVIDNKRPKNRKHSVESALTVPPSEKLVRVNSVGKPSNTLPRVPHTYTTVESRENGNGLISRTEAVPVRSHQYSTAHNRRAGSRKGNKGSQKLRSHPSLPPRHTPPPPPPPSSSSQDVGSSEDRANSEFLFSSNYASTLIKVSKLQ